MFEKIDVKDIRKNPFELIGEQWILITAGTTENCNTMTASWGGVGVLWGQPVATVYIRPQRYTYEFVERSDYFTLSFLPEDYRAALKLCGSKSGRELDKFAAAGLTVAGEADKPFVGEAELVLVCKKAYWEDIKPEHFVDGSADKWYPQKDYHRMYIGEIVEAYRRG